MVSAERRRAGSAASDRFAAALGAVEGRAHGPFPPEVAAATAVACALERAGARPVALSPADPLVAALDIEGRLRAAGADLVLPGDDGWRVRLAGAGTGVTDAFCGLAATGTVGLACGPGQPRAVSLVPPAHVCLLAAGDLVDDLAAGMALALGRWPVPPSGLVWVSGPSRSADLEMTLTLGVHGPATVDVVLVE